MPQANGRFHKYPQEHTSSEERGSIYGDTWHIKGFWCPASRFWCKHCHKFGHFSKLCYMKTESGYKKNTRKPKAHQLMLGRASAVCGQSDASYCSSGRLILFANASQVCTSKHQNASLTASSSKYRIQVETSQKRTKFLRAKIDACSNVNLMPISVYKLIYKDEDCTKLAPSNNVSVKTYITEKIKVFGFCKLCIVHSDKKMFTGSNIPSC